MISDLKEARGNMLRQQQRLGCWPDCLVNIWCELPDYGDPFSFSLDGQERSANELNCYLPSALMQRVLNREDNWNNLELGCHIMFDRKGPYLPDVHTLLCFFHKAAPCQPITP